MFKTILQPDPHEALLCEVQQRLLAISDSEMNEWFVDTLSADLGLVVAFGASNGIENTRKLGEAFVSAFSWAGAMDRSQQTELVKVALTVVGELLEEIKMWEEDGRSVAS